MLTPTCNSELHKSIMWWIKKSFALNTFICCLLIWGLWKIFSNCPLFSLTFNRVSSYPFSSSSPFRSDKSESIFFPWIKALPYLWSQFLPFSVLFLDTMLPLLRWGWGGESQNCTQNSRRECTVDLYSGNEGFCRILYFCLSNSYDPFCFSDYRRALSASEHAKTRNRFVMTSFMSFSELWGKRHSPYLSTPGTMPKVPVC